MMRQTVYLLPELEQIPVWRKAHARRIGAASLGTAVNTFDKWVEGLWEIWGDARVPVTGNQRKVFIKQLLSRQELVADTPGTAKLIAGFVGKACGTQQFERVLAEDDISNLRFSNAELAVVQICRDYFSLVEGYRLVERGTMLEYLAERLPLTRVVLVGEHDFAPNEWAFLHTSCIELSVERPYEERIGRLQEGVNPQILLPAGPSAQTQMLIDSIWETLEQDPSANVLVATPDARHLSGQLLAAFAAEEVNVAAQYAKPFYTTLFGRAFKAVFEIATADEAPLAAIADFLLSPYSGVSRARAWELDAAIRGDRNIGPNDVWEILETESPVWGYFTSFFEDSDADLGALFFVDEAQRLFAADRARCAEEQSAIAVVQRIFNQLRPYACDPRDFLFLLEDAVVKVSFALEPEEPVRVHLLDFGVANGLFARSYSQVIMPDVTSDFYSASTSHTSLDTFAKKIGLSIKPDVLRNGRIVFRFLQDAAAQRFTVSLPVTSGSDQDVFPAFFLQEFFDAYRQDAGDSVPDLPFGIPEALAACTVELGEDGVARNAGLRGECVTMPCAEPWHLQPRAVERLLPMRFVGGRKLPVLSASQIEAYASCPYKWFIERKLNPSSLDEELGPREKGDFVHALFARFYSEFQHIAPRVTEDNLSEAIDLLDQLFSEEMSMQSSLPAGKRMLPVDAQELSEVLQLRDVLKENLALQARMMDQYVPVAHEYAIAPDDEVVVAGAVLNGRIDRIDYCRETGSYAIVDYKGSLVGHAAGFSPEKHALRGEETESGRTELKALPGKIQALIYALALRRIFPTVASGAGKVVAALYLSYKARVPKQLLAGSFNPVALDLAAFTTSSSGVDSSFDEYLDLVEDALEKTVGRMLCGDIAPDPTDKNSCQYCPVAYCPRRMK